MGRFDHLQADAARLADLGELSQAMRESPHLFGTRIVGAEVTQAIQYYRSHRHLTDPLDRAPDNSARLVAYKPAWVRVYVRAAQGSTPLTARMRVERRRPGLVGVWQNAGDLLPTAPGVVTAEQTPDYALERSTLGATLNFILPSEMVRGRLRLTITLYPPKATGEAPIDTEVVAVDATLLQTLAVRGLMVAYNGPDAAGTGTSNIAAPSVADLQSTAAWTMTTNPVQSEGVFSSAGTVTLTSPLTGPATAPGGCSPGWLTLNAQLAAAKVNDGNRADVVYYGLLPSGVPMGPVIGCASSGVTSGTVNDGITMAHEIGHFAGQSHAPCGTPGDPGYPAYEPYDPAGTPMASIGEYGLDINNGTIHPPGRKDYMSYCGPRWISLYTHARLVDNEVFSPTTTDSPIRIPELMDPWVWPWDLFTSDFPPIPPEWFWVSRADKYRMKPVIAINGTRRKDTSVAVDAVMRVDAYPGVPAGLPTDMVAELIGKGGKVVASAPVLRLAAHAHGGCGCGQPGGDDAEPPEYAFQAMLANVEPGLALRIQRLTPADAAGARRDLPVWERKPSDKPASLKAVTVKVVDTEVVVSWTARAAARADKLPMSYSVQFSNNYKWSWHGCAAGLRAAKATLRLADLPSGNVTFRVLAHDGFDTVTLQSEQVELPRRAPDVTIMSPRDHEAFLLGTPIRLWAAVTMPSGERVDPSLCYWEVSDSSGKLRRVGTGLEVWLPAPTEPQFGNLVQFTVRGDVEVTVSRYFQTWDGISYLQPYPSGAVQAAAKSTKGKKPRKRGT